MHTRAHSHALSVATAAISIFAAFVFTVAEAGCRPAVPRALAHAQPGAHQPSSTTLHVSPAFAAQVHAWLAHLLGGSGDGAVDAGTVVDAGTALVDAGVVATGEGEGAVGGEGEGAALGEGEGAAVGEGEGEGTGAGEGEGGAGEGEGAGGVDAGCVMVETAYPQGGDSHVDAGQIVDYPQNPPTSGNHWPIWAKYEVHDEEVPREVYVHNLEHGAIVLLAGPNTPPEVIDELQSVYADLPLDFVCVGYGAYHKRALYVFDPLLDDPVAIVAWDHVLTSNGCVDEARIEQFLTDYRGQGAEETCGDGQWPYPPGVWPDHINDTDGGPSGMNH